MKDEKEPVRQCIVAAAGPTTARTIEIGRERQNRGYHDASNKCDLLLGQTRYSRRGTSPRCDVIATHSEIVENNLELPFRPAPGCLARLIHRRCHKNRTRTSVQCAQHDVTVHSTDSLSQSSLSTIEICVPSPSTYLRQPPISQQPQTSHHYSRPLTSSPG